MSDSHSRDTSIFCSLCNYLTITSHDHDSKNETGVCRACDLKFAQPNAKKWAKGWRPKHNEVEKFKAETQKSMYSILGEIDNYI